MVLGAKQACSELTLDRVVQSALQSLTSDLPCTTRLEDALFCEQLLRVHNTPEQRTVSEYDIDMLFEWLDD